MSIFNLKKQFANPVFIAFENLLTTNTLINLCARAAKKRPLIAVFVLVIAYRVVGNLIIATH